MRKNRSLALTAIVTYKLFEALLFAVTSIFLFFSLVNYQNILSCFSILHIRASRPNYSFAPV